jgi:hypothetical protein
MKFPRAISCAALALLLGMSAGPGLAQSGPALRSMPYLSQDPGQQDSWSYRNPEVQISKYRSFLILPTVVSADPMAKWGNSSAADRQQYAAIMTQALRNEIGKSYQIAQGPGEGVAALQLTLLGVQKTTPVVATISRVTPMGFAMNSIKSLRGKKGTMTGALHAALEVSDSKSGTLMYAAIRHRSPNALDIGATLSTEETVKAVAEDIAEAIRSGLDRANGR